jgi:hypothetical protein
MYIIGGWELDVTVCVLFLFNMHELERLVVNIELFTSSIVTETWMRLKASPSSPRLA